ncbi:MAG: hypothetical protein K9K65_08380 [Desulfarculaceae bacterium]|nr:hypothetical protein [Desulfarculaceae bacterium]MCF8048227.1 hypothetical protein [Desulfarculaceae bacterium]MCF8066690.1 hypothetical protein [Desulfarculaceae bacterium]MCF8097844.1 hypothetical protein [Desulfarculaceae bacterium]MCF8122814.1 hypothetical protein [Desulfarculaceae bacterium]
MTPNESHPELLRRVVCAGLCRYYKPNKEEDPGCGGVELLKRRPELGQALAALPSPGDDGLFTLADDDPRLLTVCEACEFRIDGCDFRDPQVERTECSPCGGLRAVAWLLSETPELKL